jgi:hypothetical protein
LFPITRRLFPQGQRPRYPPGLLLAAGRLAGAANDTDKMVALLKGTIGRDAGLIATTQNIAV